MRRVKFPVVSIILFVFAVLFAAYTIWAAIYAFNYISEMIAANQLVLKGSEFEVSNFLMSNFAQYAFFALALFALGRIVQVVSSDVEEEEDEESVLEEVVDEDEDVEEAALEVLEQNSNAE